MTKLEKKLLELGYEALYTDVRYKILYKKFKIHIALEKGKDKNKIIGSWVSIKTFANIETQQDIDNLQQAFNQLQQDLEVLKDEE